MFAKFSTAAAAAAALATLPLLASAKLTITQPTSAGWVANTTVTVAWTWDVTDPTFSIELLNPNVHDGVFINGYYAVANNINPRLNQYSFALPDVPAADGYTVSFVAISNIGSIYATSPDFAVAPNPNGQSASQPSSTNGSQRVSSTRSAASASRTAAANTTASIAASSSASAASQSSLTLLNYNLTTPTSNSASSATPFNGGSSGAASSFGKVDARHGAAVVLALGAVALGGVAVLA